jgi:hypothetical protein
VIAGGFALMEPVLTLKTFWRKKMSEQSDIYEKIKELQDKKTDLDNEIKQFKKELEELVDSTRDAEIKVVFIPEFIENEVAYLEGRFPSYDIVKINEDNRTATVKEKEEFVPKKMEFADGGQAYRRISKGKVKVDLWELQKGYPEIFSDIVMLIPELNEDRVNKRLEEDPEFLNVLEEIIKMEKPSVSFVVSKSRKKEE